MDHIQRPSHEKIRRGVPPWSFSFGECIPIESTLFFVCFVFCCSFLIWQSLKKRRINVSAAIGTCFYFLVFCCYELVRKGNKRKTLYSVYTGFHGNRDEREREKKEQKKKWSISPETITKDYNNNETISLPHPPQKRNKRKTNFDSSAQKDEKLATRFIPYALGIFFIQKWEEKNQKSIRNR